MSEERVKSATQVLGDLMTDSYKLQALLNDMSSNAQLAQEALRRLSPEPAQPPPAPAETPLPPQAAWIMGWWPGLIDAANQAAAKADPGPAADRSPEHEDLSAFRTRMEPLLQLGAQVAPFIKLLSEIEQHKDAARHFLQVQGTLRDLAGQADNLLHPPARAPWPGKISLGAPDVAAMVKVSTGRGIPQIDWSPMVEVLQAVNRELAVWYAQGQSASAEAGHTSARLTKLEADLEAILVSILTFKHQLMMLEDLPTDLDRSRRQVEDQIKRALGTQGFEEIEVLPGDPINPDCVKVTSEPHPVLTGGVVIRVIEPGYRYRLSKGRKVSVVTAQ